jgi:hypothetical protein
LTHCGKAEKPEGVQLSAKSPKAAGRRGEF